METLLATVALLGLAVAFSSPTSVAAVIVLLDLPSGVRRAWAFVVGWIAAIGVIGLALVLFPAVDFQRSRTTPSRIASGLELLIGAALVIGAVVLHRRPAPERPRDPVPAWLTRLVGRHAAIAVAAGAFMLTYSITIAAALEILKAHVGTVDRLVATAVFAVTSVVTITGPIVFAVVAPDRAEAGLARLRAWLTVHSRTIGVVLLFGIGAAIVAKAVFDLAS